MYWRDVVTRLLTELGSPDFDEEIMMRHPYMPTSRRQFLREASCGFGFLALAGLTSEAAAAANPLAARAPHFTPRAKRIIFLFMDGGPSHVDTFDYKPKLNAHAGRPHPNQNGRMSTLLPTPWTFRQRGQ